MKLYQDTSGIDKVVDVAQKYVNTIEKVVNTVRSAKGVRDSVGEMKTSTKIGLLLGGALVLSLFPLRLAFDSKTGEGEYKSLVVGVKRTQRPMRTTNERTHDVSVEMFPTVKVRPSDVKVCDLPPAEKRAPRKIEPIQARKIQKVRPAVPVILRAQEELR